MRALVISLGLSVGMAGTNDLSAGRPDGEGSGLAAHRLTGIVTLADGKRNRVVLQEAERVRELRFEALPPGLTVGERVVIEGPGRPFFPVFPDYPDKPVGKTVLDAFATPPVWLNHYLSRLRGFLRPPVDGEYTFWISGDDEAQLWLSPGSDPDRAEMIACVTSPTKKDEWDRDAGQKSLPVFLRAGEAYYLEALHRDWRGRDHVVVAWQGPGIGREVIPGNYLSPWGAKDGAERGILFEHWENFFLTSLAALSPRTPESAKFSVTKTQVRAAGGPGQLPPRRIRVGAEWPDEQNLLWVTVDGAVRFASVAEGELTLELVDGEARASDQSARMTVRVLDWGDRPAAPWLNRRLRVQGVCEQVTEPGGTRRAGLLWVQESRQLTALDGGNQDGAGNELTPVSDLSPSNLHLSWDQKVAVRATAVAHDAQTGVYHLRGEDAFSTFISADGREWLPVGSPVTVAMGDTLLAGLVASSTTDGPPAVANFDHISAALERDRSVFFGGGEDPGGVDFTGNAITMRIGGGNDWTKADRGRFLYQALTGEGELVARLASFQPGRVSDRAGLMMRASLADDAPAVALIVTHATRVDLQYRHATGEISRQVERMVGSTPQWLKLVRRQNRFTARLAEGESLNLHQPVELLGQIGWEQGAPVLREAYLRRERELPADAAVPVSSAGVQEVLIADLPKEPAESRQPVGARIRIRGVVTFMERVFGRDLLFVQDESGGTLMRALPAFFQTQRIEPGQLLQAEGQVRFTPGEPLFGLSSATVLGWGRLPEARPMPDHAGSRKLDGHWVEARGIVRSSGDGKLHVMEREGLLPVWIGGRTPSARPLESYVDARVVLRGVFTRQVSSGPLLLVPSERFIEVQEAPPEDPFLIPAHSIAQVLARVAGRVSVRRMKVSGVVTWRDDRMLCVQDGTGGAWIMVGSPGEPVVGDHVEAVGFPEREGGALTLFEAIVRRTGTGLLPAPVKMSLEDMLAGRLDARVVCLEGVVLDQKIRDSQQVLDLQHDQRVFEAVLPLTSGRVPAFAPGSRVAVTGSNRLQFAGQDRLGRGGYDLPVAATMNVMLRSPADVVLLHRPPWWNWRHTAGVVVLLGGALVWIRLLRRRVAERTRQLCDAMDRLKKETEASATLTERGRVAAEIHDTLEQSLGGITMQLDGAEAQLERDTAGARQYLAMARRMVDFSRGELRHSLWNMESTLLQGGDLGGALTEIARQMGSASMVSVQVMTSGTAQPLPAAVDHQLLRCAQEALSNALKHAGANSIVIRLCYHPDSVQLSVTDNGCGFEPDAVLSEAGKSLGLRNLRSRSRKIRARLEVTSRRGEGTTVLLAVPLPPAGSKPAANPSPAVP